MPATTSASSTALQPAAPQMAGIEAIVDLGDNISPDLLAAAADAGVKFLQVQTTGLDHVDVEGILSTGLFARPLPWATQQRGVGPECDDVHSHVRPPLRRGAAEL